MRPNANRDISKIDLMVLGLLLEKPMHGYEINRVLGLDEMQSWLDIGRTSVYYSLTRLKKQGLISETVERQQNKPDRSIYRITEAGRELFFDSLARSLAEQEKVFLEYNVGLFFINKLTKEKALEVLKKRKHFLEDWRTVLNDQLKRQLTEQDSTVTFRAVLDHTLAFADNEISWIGSFIDGIEDPSPVIGSDSIFSFSGDLSQIQLADVINMVASGSRTGTLDIKNDTSSITLEFVNGRLQYSASSSRFPRGESMEGVGSGMEVPPDVLNAFKWPEGSYTFTPDLVIGGDDNPLSIDSYSLILAGCRSVDDWGLIKKVVPSSGAVFGRSENRRIPPDNMTLSEEERKILDRVNGLRSVERLAVMTSMSALDVSRILYGLITCGLVVPVNKEKAELFDFLKLFTDTLFDRLVALKAVDIAGQIEDGLNELSLNRAMPFSLRDLKLMDNHHILSAFQSFFNMVKEFYTAEINLMNSLLGTRLARRILETIVGQLTPEMHDIYVRYGFDNLGEIH